MSAFVSSKTARNPSWSRRAVGFLRTFLTHQILGIGITLGIFVLFFVVLGAFFAFWGLVFYLVFLVTGNESLFQSGFINALFLLELAIIITPFVWFLITYRVARWFFYVSAVLTIPAGFGAAALLVNAYLSFFGRRAAAPLWHDARSHLDYSWNNIDSSDPMSIYYDT